VIGSEVILCGRVLGNTANILLVHAKVSPAAVEVTVRTDNASFSEAVVRNCAVFCK
jgi:hypothetical protein